MCHVLVIEDEPLIAMMIEDCVFAFGASSVDVALSEQEAIAAAVHRRPDFITSDVRLVKGTGPRAVAAIRDTHGDIPVLFITASPAECGDHPPEAILRKPVSFAEVGRQFRMLYH